MLNKLVLFCLFLFLSNCSLAQINDSFHYCQKQEYLYSDKSIKVSLRTNLMQLYNNDTLRIEVSVKNISLKNIYFFKDYKLHYLGSFEMKESIYIDYGDEFTDGIEYNVQMNKINPDSTLILMFEYTYQDLINKSYEGFFRVVFGIGYISNLSQVIDYIKEHPKYHFKNLDKTVEISSIALEFLLKRMSASLGVWLWL